MIEGGVRTVASSTGRPLKRSYPPGLWRRIRSSWLLRDGQHGMPTEGRDSQFRRGPGMALLFDCLRT